MSEKLDECRCIFVSVKPFCGHCGKPYPTRSVSEEEARETEHEFTKHLMARHEALAQGVREAVDLIEQYTRPDYYAWLLGDYSGQKSDPTERATKAKEILHALLNGKE